MANDEHEMSEMGLARLAELLPGITAFERKLLFRVDSDGEFSIGTNLELYAAYVGSLTKGHFFVVEELDAMCGYREDLEGLLGAMPDTAFRDRLLGVIEGIDQAFLSTTVHEIRERRVESDQWWWSRLPRRTDQRREILDIWERTPTLPPNLLPKYEAWKAQQPPIVPGKWARELAARFGEYVRGVDALAGGLLRGPSELVALCSVRDELDDGIAALAETEQRQQLVDDIDVADLRLLAATVHGRPDETSSVGASWWWWRSLG